MIKDTWIKKYTIITAHKSKAFKYSETLAEGRTTRGVAEELELSFIQLKERKEVLPQYVKIGELEEKLKDLRGEYLRAPREYKEFDELESLKQKLGLFERRLGG